MDISEEKEQQNTKLYIAVNYFLIKRLWDIKYKGLRGFYDLIGYSETTYNKVIKSGGLPNRTIVNKLHSIIGLSNDVLTGQRIIDIGIEEIEWQSTFNSWYPPTVKKDKENQKEGAGKKDEENKKEEVGKKDEDSNILSRAEINKKLHILFKRPDTIKDIEIRVLFSYFDNNKKLTEKEIIIETKRIRENQLLENALKVQRKLEPLIPQLESITWNSVKELYSNHLQIKKQNKNAYYKMTTDYEKYKEALENQLQLLQAVEVFFKQASKAREMKKRGNDD